MSCSKPRAAEDAGDDALQPAFRPPKTSDGESIWKLIAACPPLDQNSLYCNLLQCAHFPDSCILAEKNGDIVGWASAYRPLSEADALFIWQVAVSEQARGDGLARLMIEQLLKRRSAQGVAKIKTTITSDNEASWGLFRSLALKLKAPLASEAFFERDKHFGGRHETEHLITIGPFGGFAGG
jgi:L-2,4-diaminobutyric acid acetyltransferase